ncbi:MAG: cytochrome c oxidase assembly protein [Acidimicrobiaceae bacterium]
MAPLGVVAIIGAALSFISFLRRPSRRQRTQLQFIASIFSWTSLWFATASSFASSGMTNLTSHMVGHVIVMFLVPIGLVLSGTARSWWWLLPVDSRRKVLRWWNVDRDVRVPKFLFNPISAALVLNAVMVASHIPSVFDASMEHQWGMDYLLEPSFLLSGLFFFHFIVSSSPRKNKVGIRLQLFMVLSTMLEMLVMAMSLSIFSNSAWYAVMKPMAGMTNMNMAGMTMPATTLLEAFHQQQLAAGVLWVCGDFWAVPCLILIIRRLANRNGGSLFNALNRGSEKFTGSTS